MTYSEKRAQNTQKTSVSITADGISVRQGTQTGVSIRVLNEGSWGFASATDYSDELIRKAVNISRISKATQKEYGRPCVNASIQCRYEMQEPEELILWAQNAYSALNAKGITDRSVNITIEKTKTVFEASDSSEIEQTQLHAYLRARCALKGTDIAEGT